jgi:hypothetical protein
MDQNQNRKNRIDQLLHEAELTQGELLRQMLRLSGQDPYKGYEKQKGNFSKKLSGERDFSGDEILQLERTLHTSWRYIVDGTDQDKNFAQKGLRYAAYKGDYESFAHLGAEESHGNLVIKHYDEYDNSILDYIFDYKAIEGLRYLVDKKLITLYFDCNTLIGDVMSSRGPNQACKEALLLICEKDDEPLFWSLFNPYQVLKGSDGGSTIFDDPDALAAMLGTKNILASLLKDREFTLKELNPHIAESRMSQQAFRLCVPCLSELLVYALHDPVKYQAQLEKILQFGKFFNEDRIAKLEEMSEEEKNDITLNEAGAISCGRVYIGDLFTYRLTEQIDLSPDLARELAWINDQINRVKFREKPLANALTSGDSRIIDGQVVKRTSGNEAEYTFLKLMEENGVKETPRLIKQENGLDYFAYFPGESAYYMYTMPMERTLQAVKFLRKINEISGKTLANGKVYCHGSLSGMSAVFDKDVLVGVTDWDGTHVGEEYEDFVYLAWTWLNIGDYTRDNEKILDNLIVLLKAYGADESFKKGFADKMLAVMDKQLANTPKDSKQYARIFQWVGWSKIWVELMKDAIKERIG